MMRSGEVGVIQKTPSDVQREVEELTSEIKTFETFATSAGFIGAALGSVLAIPLGPIAFVSGTALGAVAVGGLKAYVQARKKNIEKQLQSLIAQNLITEDAAGKIRERLGLIHTDNLPAGEFSPPAATATGAIQKQ